MKQKEQVKQWFLNNNNCAIHYKDLAHELNILVPNMRRILGQGTIKNEFVRVASGIYKLNKDNQLKPNKNNNVRLLSKLNQVLINDNGKLSINKNDFNKLIKTLNNKELKTLEQLIK